MTDRQCGACTLCCKLLAIEALDKPKDSWCVHCRIGSGCTIYTERPTPCRTFECGYLLLPTLGEHWFPARSKLILASEEGGQRLIIHVDPARPNAWRDKPYYQEIKAWGRAAADVGDQVWVMVGANLTVILPDAEVNLGLVDPEDGVVSYRRNTPGGPVWVAERVDKNDPRLAAAKD